LIYTTDDQLLNKATIQAIRSKYGIKMVTKARNDEMVKWAINAHTNKPKELQGHLFINVISCNLIAVDERKKPCPFVKLLFNEVEVFSTLDVKKLLKVDLTPKWDVNSAVNPKNQPQGFKSSDKLTIEIWHYSRFKTSRTYLGEARMNIEDITRSKDENVTLKYDIAIPSSRNTKKSEVKVQGSVTIVVSFKVKK